MVLFIRTRGGYEDMRSLISPQGCPVWTDFGVLTEDEINSLRESGVDLSNFTLPHDFDHALEVIAQHHPGERIWVEIENPYA
jgi:hypothetical protein